MKAILPIFFFALSQASFADPGLHYSCSGPDHEWKLSARIIPASFSTIGVFSVIGPKFKDFTGKFTYTSDLINGRRFEGRFGGRHPFSFTDKLTTFSMEVQRESVPLECEFRSQDIPVKACPTYRCYRGGAVRSYTKVLAEESCGHVEKPDCI